MSCITCCPSYQNVSLSILFSISIGPGFIFFLLSSNSSEHVQCFQTTNPDNAFEAILLIVFTYEGLYKILTVTAASP